MREILWKNDSLALHVWYTPNLWVYSQKTGHIIETTFILLIKSVAIYIYIHTYIYIYIRNTVDHYSRLFFCESFFQILRKTSFTHQKKCYSLHSHLTLWTMTKSLVGALMFIFCCCWYCFCYLYMLSETVTVLFSATTMLFLETKLPEWNLEMVRKFCWLVREKSENLFF